MNVVTELISRWFQVRQSLPTVASDVLFFALGVLLALKPGTKKTPVYLMISAVIVYAVCSIMVMTNDSYFGAMGAEYVGAMAFMMFCGNVVGYIIRLLKKDKKDAS